MSLRHALLGLLARRPSSGYELTQMFDRSLSTSWHAGHSQIYPELGKLEAAGLIRLVGEGARRSKTYDITDAGRVELRRWLVEAEPDRSQRSESGLRLFLTPLLDAADRKQTFERDLAHVEHELAALKALRAVQADAAEPEVFAPQVELGIRINTVLGEWLREQISTAS
ncbi:PadR family transcriptional regulator [Nocardioides nematodiphilus]|uniref:PadR family transcriptional regulator n=1 Tax=Nocardioides nematodiphilus TaxID=2849669 RepID=UPI001CDA4D50|nr:PadR family transcriptional regulator [Nocardioides nematodiphilus]MCA1984728.1 PadR family transcriptional regulator [Nocardioides nematodiphilus]